MTRALIRSWLETARQCSTKLAPLSNVPRRLAGLLLPPDCVLCAAPARDELLCPACAAEMPRLPAGERCRLCGLPLAGGGICGHCQLRTPPFDLCQVGYAYRTPLPELVARYKFAGHLALAAPLAHALARDVLSRRSRATLPELLVPMPLHRRRLAERGFNQATEIAILLGRMLDIPVRRTACRRLRDTPHQTGLRADERRGNLRAAFACAGLDGRHVALVDDVMTTGSSMAELSRAARAAGAAGVEAWAVCRAGREAGPA